MSGSESELVAELGEPREVLEQLTPEEAAKLLRLFKAAKVEQKKSLDAAIDGILDALPRLIRIPARKILFGR
ncbi:hypothetical protein [Antrihabitans sp. YC2-6]|uniref:hypothetical protein n=1 Tax=Antrihabitans sp. YC2-6 TaxID=2799498 RepID=UPI0018F2CC8E|nr:hypothetical protein [Antrihabitans sp. YC2-6]MBJ8345218.1 hypothetical protein [Antrihabitans sp. YC2-6]